MDLLLGARPRGGERGRCTSPTAASSPRCADAVWTLHSGRAGAGCRCDATSPRAVARELRGGRALFLLAVAGRRARRRLRPLDPDPEPQRARRLLGHRPRGLGRGRPRRCSAGPARSTRRSSPRCSASRASRRRVPLWRAPVALEGDRARCSTSSAPTLLAAVRVPWRARRGRRRGRARRAGLGGGDARARRRDGLGGGRRGSRSPSARAARRSTVGALVDLRRVAPLASRRLAVMDIAQAQALLGVRGRIHQIDVRAARGRRAGRALAARLEARLGERARVAHPRAAHRGGRGAPRRVPPEPHGALARVAPRGRLPRVRLGPRLARAPARGARRPARGRRHARAGARGWCSPRRRCSAPPGRRSGIPLGWLAARANVARGERHDPQPLPARGDRRGDARRRGSSCSRARPASRGAVAGALAPGARRGARGPARAARVDHARGAGPAPAPGARSPPARRRSRAGALFHALRRAPLGAVRLRARARRARRGPARRAGGAPAPRARGAAAPARRAATGSARWAPAARVVGGRGGRARGRGRDARRRDRHGRELPGLGGALARRDPRAPTST